MDNVTNISKPVRYCNSSPTDLIGDVEKRLTLTYPFLLTICLISNLANLAIYQHKLLRTSTTIRMLCAKAVANMVNTLVMFPNFLKSVPQWAEKRSINDLYWQGLPYMMFILNIFATFAIWLTLLVSVERYIMVGFPIQAKMWCNMRNVSIAIILTFLAAIGLQTQSFVARKLYIVPCVDTKTWTRSYYYLYVVPKIYEKLQMSYHYTYSISTIFIPMIAMILTTLLINYHLFWSSKTFANSAVEQKRCVTRLSLSTTVSHLIFETPHLVIFIVAAVGNVNDIEFWTRWDAFIGVANFLSVVNNSIPFFVYLLCSKRYRQIARVVLCRGSSAELTNNALTKAQEHTGFAGGGGGGGDSRSHKGEQFAADDKKKRPSKRRFTRAVTTHVSMLPSTNTTIVRDNNFVVPATSSTDTGAGQPVVFVNGIFLRKRSHSWTPKKNDNSNAATTTSILCPTPNTGGADSATENTSLLEFSSRSLTDK